MYRAKAFSLTELIVVMVIIAIGAAFAMPSLGKGIENQKMKSVQSSVRYLRDQVLLYAKEYNDGTLPSTGTTNNDLSQLFNAHYLVPDDLAFYTNPGLNPGTAVTWAVPNYSVQSFVDNINTAGNKELFKACGTFSPTLVGATRNFCIYQCMTGGRESTETDSVRDSCP
jgi:prepilin-type N-terminal cleavage/methylation domain-containing protein